MVAPLVASSTAPLPLPQRTCQHCGGDVRAASYGADWHLICRRCYRTLSCWSARLPRWRDPAEPDPPYVPPTPAVPWATCPQCAGNLRITRETAQPEIWDLMCEQAAHRLATWEPGMPAWHILTAADTTPTPAQARALDDARYGAHLPVGVVAA